jgi:hypothetical protein
MKKSLWIILYLLLPLLIVPCVTYGQSDLFEIKTPNVMIIFDSSSSMERDTNGLTVNRANLAVDKDGRYPATEKSPNSYWFEAGGNSPLSKLYIAKYALKDVIKDLETVNIGFATYGQRKSEQWRGYYKKWVITQAHQNPVDYCYKRYWRWRSIVGAVDGSYTSNDFAPDKFVDVWGKTQTGVTKGYSFTRTVNVYDKAASSIPPHDNLKTKPLDITYTVTSITFNAEFGWWQYTYISNPYSFDWYEETWQYLWIADCSTDKLNDPFPRNWAGGWSTYFKGEAEYDDPYSGKQPKSYWKCNHYHQDEILEKWGWSWQWRTYSGTQAAVCKDQADGWQYLSNCYDVSDYYYPIGPGPALGFDATDRPHVWSYFKIGKKGQDYWAEDLQQKPSYYPAPDDAPGNQSNHYFFTNFPEVDDSLNGFKARDKIVSWLDVSPDPKWTNPETGYLHTKSPVKPDSVTSNTLTSVYTPLADSLYWAKKYFNDYINTYNGGDDASKSGCRGNYVILMTDGLESARVNADGTPKFNEVYDAAKALFDLVKDKGGNSNGVKTYVIGFGEGFQGNNAEAIKNIAKAGGDTVPYFASDLEGLRNAFKKIFEAIGGSYGRSTPVVARDRGSIYRGFFNLPGWEGHLKAFAINGDGTVGSEKWDAADKLNATLDGNRKLYTWIEKKKGPKREDFNVANAGTVKDEVNKNPPEDLDWNGVAHSIGDGKIDTKDTEAVINFIRDASYGMYNDGKKDIYPYAGTRTPKWKLGDIYHSTPVVVSDPPFIILDGDFPKPYSEYKKNNQGREAVVYVGANDGMLHAFANDGNEKFSISPSNLLSGLKGLRSGHQFFADSSPRAFDIFNYSDKEWRTILISGQRGGGDRYFAIDVTDPKAGDYPKILWQADDADGNRDPKPRKMGNTWSRPEIGRVEKKKSKTKKANDIFVAFVGGGYSNIDDVGNTFYAIEAEDGDILRKFEIGDTKNKVPAGATAFDSDGDGRTDAVYFGDYNGVLWKIAIVGTSEDDWKLVKLYDPGADKPPRSNFPIFYPPTVTKNKKGEVLVYFGQGNELDLFEKTNTYSFFEIKDPGSNTDGSGVNNWEIKFDNKGEKVLASPAVGNNVVYFTTWQYTGIESNCGAGVGRIYALTQTNPGVDGGGAAFYIDVDTGAPLGKPQKSFELGKGIPTAPIVTNKGIYVSSSLDAGKIRFLKIPPWGTNRLKSWREVF